MGKRASVSSIGTGADDGADNGADLRHDWTREEIAALFDLPFFDLVLKAHQVHRMHFDPHAVEGCTLLNIKSGGCPEDCGYCSQSARHGGDAEITPLMDIDEVRRAARAARAAGAKRFCMGAAFRSPKPAHMPRIIAMIRAVKEEGLETCMTLGMLSPEQVRQLREAGLDYYNHNIDTSPEHYANVITTRRFEDRLQTLRHVQDAGIKVCCGGILGLGETRADRISMLRVLACMQPHPASVPINRLVPMPGTPLQDAEPVDDFEFIRSIAVARIVMPKSRIRLAAGRREMSAQMQAWCFLAGANSIFTGEKLLTCDNAGPDADARLLEQLGLRLEPAGNAEQEATTTAVRCP